MTNAHGPFADPQDSRHLPRRHLLQVAKHQDYPIPGTERVIASDPGFIAVLLEHSDLLQFDGTGWPRIGNLFDGVTATRTPNRQHDLG